MLVNGEVITRKTIAATRAWFVSHYVGIAEEQTAKGKDSTFWRKAAFDIAVAKRFSVTFMQRAYFIQTSKDLPLLP